MANFFSFTAQKQIAPMKIGFAKFHVYSRVTMANILFKILCFSLLMTSFSVSASELADYFDRSSGDESVEIDHSLWNEFLSSYVHEEEGLNYFGYEEVSDSDKERLNQYIKMLESIIVRELTPEQQFAYWVNFYNSVTIKVVLDHYPVESIREISSGLLRRGPWKEKLVEVEGMELSLDDIEHEILRPIFEDNRIHYAVNCASIGCPNLQDQAFTSDNLESLLDFAARQYVNHPRGVFIEDGELFLSSIYDWYAEDFGDNDREIIGHLLQYANVELAVQLMTFDEISDYDYDWDLNE